MKIVDYTKWTDADYAASVAKVTAAKSEYLDEAEKKFNRRQSFRRRMNIKTLAICGHSRAGKDQFSELLHQNRQLPVPPSASLTALPLIAEALRVSDEPVSLPAVYAARHEHRVFWFRWLNAFRAEDPDRLVRMSLGLGDVVVGIRSESELRTSSEKGWLSLIVWIDRDVPPDPTLEYGVDLCDVIVPNRAGLHDLTVRAARLSLFMWHGLSADGFSQGDR